jgi:hypothetical protein
MNLSSQQLNEILARPGIRQANPALGAVGSPKHAEPPRALERHAPPKQSRKGGVLCCVEIIGLRHRILDSDNFIAGAKGLRDTIASSVGIDDGSDQIEFLYGQFQTRGEPGTIVRISWI